MGYLDGALTVGLKEFMEHLRTKRLLVVGSMFLVTVGLGLWVGTLVDRTFNDSAADFGLHRSVFILGFYFGLFPLINGINFTSILGILLSADAVVGEWKDRTLFLVLSKPVTRTAFLVGKFLGALFAVVSVYLVAFVTAVTVAFAIAGVPDGEGLARIFASFGLIFIGMVPFIAMALLSSVMFRTPAASFIMVFGAWFILLPMLGNLGLFIRLAQRGGEAIALNDGFVQSFHYIDPTFLMRQGASYLLGGEQFGFFETSGQKVEPGLVILAAALHVAVWFGLSVWRMNRRDYA